MSETSEEQATTAALRARFLNLISRLAGKDCKIDMYGDSESCKMIACDASFKNVLAGSLETPEKTTILPAQKLISMKFAVDDINKLSNE